MFTGLMDWLAGLIGDPVSYLFFFFIFCILAAIILPIPVELGLLGLVAYGYSLFGLEIFASYVILSTVMGLGKAVGGVVVFGIGVKLEDDIRRWVRWGWFQWLMEKSSWLVSKLGYVGLFIILSIPGMTDTVPLYLFSLLNKDGDVFDWKYFFVTNFLAGFARCMLVGVLVAQGITAFL